MAILVSRLGALLLLGLVACERQAPPPAVPPSPAPTAAATPATTLTFPGADTLLLAQAQFQWEVQPDGRKLPKPGAAKLLLLTPSGGAFVPSLLEDPESRVFHKAICVGTPAGTRLLTIGATESKLKLWRVEAGAWQSETLWTQTFGGKWDRLRDVELGSVDDDPENEIVIATHDQGVVAVGDRRGDGWVFQELCRSADTFVHEIEIGDVDGDGRNEIFATPSRPNKADQAQSGTIVRFRWVKGKYQKTTVAEIAATHAKEILVTDVDGDGTAELYAAIEAVRGKGGEEAPVEIRRFIPGPRTPWKHQTVATLPGAVQARVLLAGDLTKSGRTELIATTMKKGIWRLVPPKRAGDAWTPIVVDPQSGGFEHAAAVEDLDGDGTPELYVSADEQDEISRYRWDGHAFVKTVLAPMDRSDLTWTIAACRPIPL